MSMLFFILFIYLFIAHIASAKTYTKFRTTLINKQTKKYIYIYMTAQHQKG